MGVDISFQDFLFLLRSRGGATFFQNTGINWVRADLVWQNIETKTTGKGHYDFSNYDSFISLLPSGVKPYFILDYGNPLYEPCPTDPTKPCANVTQQPTIDGYNDFASNAVGHYVGKGYHWEIWNEPNDALFWPTTPPPGNLPYSDLALQASQKLRQNPTGQSYPNEYLVGPAYASESNLYSCGGSFPTGDESVTISAVETLLGQPSALQYWNGLSAHFYRGPWPETLDDCDLANLQSIVRSTAYNPTGKSIDIISGEWGYSSLQPNMPGTAQDVNEYGQASYLSRMWLYNAALGIRYSIWYSWHDTAANQGYGIVRYQANPPFTTGDSYNPKPAYYAATAIVSPTTGYFRGFHFDSTNPLNQTSSANIVLAFTNGIETRYTVWTTSPTSLLNLNVPSGEYFVVSNLGSALSYNTIASGGLQLQLTRAPVFVLSPANAATFAVNDIFRQALGRNPTSAELQTYTTELSEGVSVASIIQTIVQTTQSQSAINGLYTQYQGASPTPHQLACSTAALEDGTPWSAVTDAIRAFPPPASPSLTSLLSGTHDHIYYSNCSPQINEILLTGSGWTAANLSTWAAFESQPNECTSPPSGSYPTCPPNTSISSPATGAANALTSLLYTGNEDHVWYIGSDQNDASDRQHVWEFWWDGTNWQDADLTQWTGAPVAASGSALTSLLYPGSEDHVEYIGSDIHVHELWYNSSGWHTTDLTQQTGAPNAASPSALTSLLYTGSEDHVEYIGSDMHVHEFWYNGSIWQTTDLTQQTGAPNAASHSALTSLLYIGSQDHVEYIGSDMHVHEFWYNGSIWQTTDLTQQTGAPNAASSSALTSLLYAGSEDHVEYIGSDMHVHEFWYNGSIWQTTDLTQQTGAPNAASPSALTSLLYTGNEDHVEYIGSDMHVHEFWYNGSIWQTVDMTQMTGAPL
jgi:hypothetical protein